LLEASVQARARSSAWNCGEKPDAPDLSRLLRTRRERPSRSRTAEERDDLAPFHCLMPPCLREKA
jgi:hypothetical protein